MVFFYQSAIGGENTHWGTVMSVVGQEDPDQKQVTTIMTDDKFCSCMDCN